MERDEDGDRDHSHIDRQTEPGKECPFCRAMVSCIAASVVEQERGEPGTFGEGDAVIGITSVIPLLSTDMVSTGMMAELRLRGMRGQLTDERAQGAMTGSGYRAGCRVHARTQGLRSMVFVMELLAL